MKKIIICLAILGLWSCETEDSNDVPEGIAIYQDYKVRYSDALGTTRLSATFREKDENGVRLILSGDSRLEANSETVNYFSNAGNYFYRWDKNGLLDVQINYIKNANTSFLNIVTVDSKRNFVLIDTDSLSLAGGSKIKWNTPLQANEFLDYRIEQGGQSGGAGYWAQAGSTDLAVSTIIIGGLTQGPAELIISRSIESNQLDQVDGNSNNGKLIIEYEQSFPVMLY